MQRGDLVYLKSGGPLMTVESVSADNQCVCRWFPDDYMPRKFTFHSDALELEDDDDLDDDDFEDDEGEI